MRLIITRHVGREGVTLSKPGHWGNLPFPDDAAATAEAHRLAGDLVAIEREVVRPRRVGR